jgi:hypothetical protein
MSSDILIEPKPPARKQMLYKDFTIESLAQMCAANQEAVMVINSEINAFLKGMAGYNNSEQKNRAIYLTTYDGDTNTINRAKNGLESIEVNNFSMGILGGAQPVVVRDLLNSADDGSFERYLTIWPQKQTDRKYDPDAMIEYDKYYQAFSILSQLEPINDEETEEIKPLLVTMSNEEAIRKFRHWYEVSRTKEEKTATQKELQISGKADGLVLRLALILDYIWWASEKINNGDDDALGFPTEISPDAIDAAIRLREHYLRPMNSRCMGSMTQSPVMTAASRLCQYIVQKGLVNFNKTDIRKTNVIGRNGEFIDDVLDTLVKKNWIEWKTKKVKKGAKGRPTLQYYVKPKVWELVDELS